MQRTSAFGSDSCRHAAAQWSQATAQALQASMQLANRSWGIGTSCRRRWYDRARRSKCRDRPLYRQSCDTPLRHAVLKASRLQSLFPQQPDRLVGHQAERAAAVGDDLFSPGQLAETLLEVLNGNVDGPRHVAGRKLFRWSNIEDRHEAFARPVQQFLRGNRLEIVLRKEVEPDDALDLRVMGFARPRECGEKLHDPVAGDAVENELPLLASDDEARVAQFLQVLRSIRDRSPGECGKIVHASLALAEQFQELQADAARQGRADASQLGENVALRALA